METLKEKFEALAHLFSKLVLFFHLFPEQFEFESPAHELLWKEMEKENKFRKKMESALKETLFIGDGAFKAVIDTSISDYPILEWYPGDRGQRFAYDICNA